jgi:hypothetical protein
MHSFEDDKELDQITRSAAEAYEAPSAGNWDMMQRVLDRELPQQKKRRFGIIWWIFPGLLAIGLGFYFMNTYQKQPNHNSTVKALKTNTLIPTQQLIESEIKTVQNISQLPINKSINQPILINHNIDASTKSVASNTLFAEEPVKSNLLEVTSKEPQVNHNIATIDMASSIVSEKPNTINQTSQPDTAKTINHNATAAVEPIADLSNKSVMISPKNKKGFFVGLVGGVDVSTVKYNYASKPGYNIGATIGYRINNHWSVQTGAVYTQKNYKLKGEDFNPPKGSWISYYNIETVDGYCKMWDIPIIGTYHFNSNGKTNTFISIGTSSYFMKAESYNYLYNYNNQYYNRSSKYNSNDQHLFALLHISAGVEKSIGKNITTIIEPYAKIPLAGVGYGNIQLSSFGLNFSVLYKQPKK